MHKDKFPLFAVVAFSIFICLALIIINSSSNILGHNYRDAYLYLIQAYHFAGTPIGGYDYVNYYSPLIPFLTSLLFRLGFVSEASLFAVTGLFYPIAVIGIYFLLNLRFDKFYSMLGAILYGSMSINLMWTANGTLDIPSVALSIWAVYFFIKGLESNQKFFYLAFPLLVLSVFAKYTGALTILVMMVYLLSKRDIIGNFVKYIKNIIGGIITSFVFIIPFLSYYIINGLPFGFINQAREVSTETISSNTAAAPANDLFFYISSLPRFIYSPQKILGYFILLVAAVGVIYGIYKLINYLKEHYKDSANRLEISFYPKIRLNKNVCFIALAVSIIMIILTFLTAGMTSFIISELLLLIGLAIFASCFNSIFTDLADIDYANDKETSSKYKYFRFDFAMISWFLIYLVFFSSHLIKADRYFTALVPGFVFILVYSIERVTYLLRNNNSKFNISKEKAAKGFLAMLLILLLAASIGYLTIDRHD
ncbi:MAG: glycosyltransferase family 39 protein, partial [Methanobrevibacter sp.]|nr:glycosyltransferase family 39 protein [Methanobrevibacter sp.]